MKEIEIHLIIIWSEGLHKRDDIIKDISNKLDILEVCNVTWSKNKFSENLSRFYGENLPKNSNKEIHCGSDTFTCIIVRDSSPKYDIRKTSKGSKIVNINLFDMKKNYRIWTGGGHKIHASDNTEESKLQLVLLFNKHYADYQKKMIGSYEELTYKKDLIGSDGWKSLDEVFYVLNEALNYVVLRNFDNLDEELNALHPDIDLLTENIKLAANVLNGVKTTSKAYRVQYSVLINKKLINFDLRWVGDNYYCSKWERAILKDRVLFVNFYIPSSQDYFYSLLYHAYIHKREVSFDYILKLIELSKPLDINLTKKSFIENNTLNFLINFMDKKNYEFSDPKDLTVYYNYLPLSRNSILNISTKRHIKNNYLKFRSGIKKYINRKIRKIIK
jgi:hypothetical protein